MGRFLRRLWDGDRLYWGQLVKLMIGGSLREVIMYFSNDYESRKEHYKDLLREAEKERLLFRAIAGGKKLNVWQSIVGLLVGSNRQ